MNKNRKFELLSVLASTICPICWKQKAAQGWTCLECGNAHRATPEHDELAQKCAEHVNAAEAYLNKIRKLQP